MENHNTINIDRNCILAIQLPVLNTQF